jgi:hypothetical protein
MYFRTGKTTLRYSIVKVWANWDSEKEMDTESYFSCADHARERCAQMNDARSGIYFHAFKVKDRGY